MLKCNKEVNYLQIAKKYREFCAKITLTENGIHYRVVRKFERNGILVSRMREGSFKRIPNGNLVQISVRL